MKQEPAAEAAEAAEDAQDYDAEYAAYSWGAGGGGSIDGGWTGPAAPSTGTSADEQRDALVKVETKYDN